MQGENHDPGPATRHPQAGAWEIRAGDKVISSGVIRAAAAPQGDAHA